MEKLQGITPDEPEKTGNTQIPVSTFLEMLHKKGISCTVEQAAGIRDSLYRLADISCRYVKMRQYRARQPPPVNTITGEFIKQLRA